MGTMCSCKLDMNLSIVINVFCTCLERNLWLACGTRIHNQLHSIHQTKNTSRTNTSPHRNIDQTRYCSMHDDTPHQAVTSEAHAPESLTKSGKR